MTDKPFCLIDEAAKAIARAYCPLTKPALVDEYVEENFHEWRHHAKAVLDRVVPLIVERCAEVVDEYRESHPFKVQKNIGFEIATAIRALKPKEKSDG